MLEFYVLRNAHAFLMLYHFPQVVCQRKKKTFNASRKRKNHSYMWEVVQSGVGGGDTVSTTSYPEYAAIRAKAKASAPSHTPASSSSSWAQTTWTQWQWQSW